MKNITMFILFVVSTPITIALAQEVHPATTNDLQSVTNNEPTRSDLFRLLDKTTEDLKKSYSETNFDIQKQRESLDRERRYDESLPKDMRDFFVLKNEERRRELDRHFDRTREDFERLYRELVRNVEKEKQEMNAGKTSPTVSTAKTIPNATVTAPVTATTTTPSVASTTVTANLTGTKPTTVTAPATVTPTVSTVATTSTEPKTHGTTTSSNTQHWSDLNDQVGKAIKDFHDRNDQCMARLDWDQKSIDIRSRFGFELVKLFEEQRRGLLDMRDFGKRDLEPMMNRLISSIENGRHDFDAKRDFREKMDRIRFAMKEQIMKQRVEQERRQESGRNDPSVHNSQAQSQGIAQNPSNQNPSQNGYGSMNSPSQNGMGSYGYGGGNSPVQGGYGSYAYGGGNAPSQNNNNPYAYGGGNNQQQYGNGQADQSRHHHD